LLSKRSVIHPFVLFETTSESIVNIETVNIETIAHTTGPGRSQEKKKNPRPPKRAWDPTAHTAGAVLLLSLSRLLFARKKPEIPALFSKCQAILGGCSVTIIVLCRDIGFAKSLDSWMI
jgi:hypothetical protein